MARGTDGEAVLSTLAKGIDVLEAVVEVGGARGLTLTELSHHLGLHRSTLARFLTTLQRRGYLERDPATERYRPGLRVLTLSAAVLTHLQIRDIARPVLEALRDETGEMTHLTVLDNGEVVTVDRAEGHNPLTLRTEIGSRRPAYCTASGKAMLAYLPPDVLEGILARGLPPVTPNTITDPAVLRAQLAEVRRRGYAWDDEERIPGVRCVAAPVFDHTGQLVGALSLSVPSMRADLARLAELGERIRRAGETVSRRLGYRAPADGPADLARPRRSRDGKEGEPQAD